MSSWQQRAQKVDSFPSVSRGEQSARDEQAKALLVQEMEQNPDDPDLKKEFAARFKGTKEAQPSWQVKAVKAEAAPAEKPEVKAESPQPARRQRTVPESMARGAGLAARATLTGLTGLPYLAADVAYNFGARPLASFLGKELPPHSQAAQFQQTLSTLGLPEPEHASERIAQDVGAGMVGGAGGGGKALVNIASGAGAGGAGGAVREAGGGFWAQVLASLLGAKTGAAAVPAAAAAVQGAKAAITPTALSGVEKMAAQQKVPLAFSDMVGKSSPVEDLPLSGMPAFRVQQREAARQAAERQAAAFGEGGKPAAGVVQGGIEQRGQQMKETASKLYDRLAAKADPLGPIPTTQSSSAIDKLLAQEGSKVLPDKGLISVLEKAKEGLGQGRNFSNLRSFRSDLGSLISDYYKGTNAVVGEKGVAALQQVRDAITQDMGAFAAQKGGDVGKLWKGADSFYKQQVVGLYKDRTIANLTRETDPTKIYSMVNAGGAAKPETLYAALPPQGRQAYKAMLVNDVYADAMKGGNFSPKGYVDALEKRQNELGVFFKGSEKAELDGLKSLMGHIQKAEKAEIPKYMPLLFVEGMIRAPKSTAAALTAGRAMTALNTTPWGRRFLAAASKAEPGSQRMSNLMAAYAPQLNQIMQQSPEE